MSQPYAGLKEAGRVEILTLVDNYVDLLLPGTEIVTRPPLARDGNIPPDTLLAEHGLSLLITVHEDGRKHSVLFDTGYTRIGLLHNMALLDTDIEEIEAVVLSHGHMDHTGSLYPLLERISRSITLVVHPQAFHAPRYFGLPDGKRLLFPKTLEQKDLETRKIELLAKESPTLLAGGMILVTGSVERGTDFEKGLPNALMERNGKMERDDISDDQALVIKLKRKGLVVISGCSHAGIVNTVLYAQKLTGVESVHAVMGGFHLSGPHFEAVLERTIAELKKMQPEVVVPMHCTGWKAISRFSEEFPSEFILNSVGSKVTLVG